jgi:hypothetical protein
MSNDKMMNPFAVQVDNKNINQGSVAIEQSRAVTEAQGKLILAKRFPRNQSEAYSNIVDSCKRITLAESAIYSYPKGGQTVSGPSIRLAEELIRIWGNAEYGIRELSQGDGFSEMESFAWDLQTNVYSSQRFNVTHKRFTRQGVVDLTDSRDIYELTANQGARRLRARILAILPPDLVEMAVEQCKNTLKTQKVDKKTLDKMISVLESHKITQDMICKRFSKAISDLTQDDVVELRGIYNSIKDNQSSAKDWFPVKGEPAKSADPVYERALSVIESCETVAELDSLNLGDEYTDLINAKREALNASK